MRYAILTTPRTGGRALCDCLAQTGVAGMVGKDGGLRGNELYIGTGELLAKRDVKREVDDFFAANRTPNGVEGVKINFPYLMTLQKWVGWEPVEAIVRSLDYAVILERQDKVAQAVSLYFAQALGEWSSLQRPLGLAPKYDYNEIAARIARIEMAHAWIDAFVRDRVELSSIDLTYEVCVENTFPYVATVVCRFLGFPTKFERTVRLKKQENPKKQEFVKRFKEERGIRDPNLV